MSFHEFGICVESRHRVVFGRDFFAAGRSELAALLREGGGRRVLVFVEQAVAQAGLGLERKIEDYFADLEFDLRGIRVLPGGEPSKGDETVVRRVWQEIAAQHIDRHSYLLVIGGGAFLDAVGFAAATAHRGVRLVRFPTTVLSQDDSGVGVKCAINWEGRKNWIGSFGVPFAVVNDFSFLRSQPAAERRAGLVEAVKVALVKDREFFSWIEAHLVGLVELEWDLVEECVERSALLHVEHIAGGGDPFECGSSRPLDFGHWAAHKLEQLSGYRVSHARAVAIGMALDTLYSARCGLLRECEAERILDLLEGLCLAPWDDVLDLRDEVGRRLIHEGLDDFREHLGGELTVLLLREPGCGQEVHALDEGLVDGCLDELKRRGELRRYLDCGKHPAGKQ